MLTRTQVQLTEQQHRRLREVAQRQGVSIAELVRRGVDLLLESEPQDRQAAYQRASELLGALKDPSGTTDLSTNHDDYLDEAYR